jgi:hypothetical protein
MRLDYPVDSGLLVDQFRGLFIQCLNCQTCLTRRNITYHNCDSALDMHQRTFTQDGDREQLLHGYGELLVERFEAVFAHCAICGKVMTLNSSHGHHCKLWEELFGDE